MPQISERLLAALGSSYTIERELTGGGMARVFVEYTRWQGALSLAANSPSVAVQLRCFHSLTV